MADGMLSLSWNNHRATFCHILATLREKERYTDVTVACEGKFYPVHKLVLSTCSEYFEKIFENTPCKHPVIVLKDVNRCDLEALFCYMYEGAVSVAQSNLGRLIKAAEVLRIKGLAVPDEPPISDSCGRRAASSHHHHASDDRSSPHPKRRRREENSHTHQGRTQASPSPPSSPRPSPLHDGGESHPVQRSRSDSQWGEHGTADREDGIDGLADDRLGDHSTTSLSAPTPPLVEVMVDETLVKEEMIDHGDTGQEDMMDSGMDYGSVGSDSRLEGSAGGGGEEDHMIPGKYEPKANPSQQPIPEAVVEALAGPSGMQTWLGGGEMPSGFSGLEGYTGGEGGQDLHPPSQAPAPHQLVWRETISQEGEGRLPKEGCQGTPSPATTKLSCPSPPSSSTSTTTTTTTYSSSTTASSTTASSSTASSSFSSCYASLYGSIPHISSISPSISISPCPATSPPSFPTLVSVAPTVSSPSSCFSSTISFSPDSPQEMPPPPPPSSPPSRSFAPSTRGHIRPRIHSHFTHSHHHLQSPSPHIRPISQQSQFPPPSSPSFPGSPSTTTATSTSSTISGLETALGEDKKPFCCEYCPYKTTRKTAMKEHINSHTGKKPHACPFCPYRTCWNSSMVVHMRTHTGEKPYSCPHCNYQATQRSSLKAHLLTHQSPSFFTTTTTTSALTTSISSSSVNEGATTVTADAGAASGPALSVSVADGSSSPTSVNSQHSMSLSASTSSLLVSEEETPSHTQQPSTSFSPPSPSLTIPQHSPATSSVTSLLPFQHTPSFLTTRHHSSNPSLATHHHHHSPSSLLSHLSSSFAMPSSPSLAILQSSSPLQIPQTPSLAISHTYSLNSPQSPSLSSHHPSLPR